MMKYQAPAKKALATFVFASTGILVGGALGGLEVWKTALWAGVGALINFLYRASEQFINDSKNDA
jgi:uncharacterized oligopeptide transporter (OPT) family protein